MEKIEKPISTKVPTQYGELWFYAFKIDDQEIVAIINKKNIKKTANVRLHSCCFTSEIFGSLKCDCALQLEYFMSLMSKNRDQNYLLIYFLNHEGRGIGLFNKLKAYEVQRKLGLDTYQANEYLGFPHDVRDYSPSVKILRYFGIEEIILHSNNPDKANFLIKNGFVVRIKKIFIKPHSKHALNYLIAKVEKGNHLIKSEIDALTNNKNNESGKKILI
ncbi:MAG: GTP cyclohydrolase II [Patescibacteria group bacterium]|nr:GTP cyclohydrolase II [Patescibacteria group bacterium]